MRGTHTLSIVLLSLALFTGAAKEDITKGLSTFERSLTEWMRSMETLHKKLDALEAKVDKGTGASPELTKTLREIAVSVGELRKSMTKFNTRLTRIEDSLGGAAAENPMITFGRTLDILKKNLAELGKKVSDQAAMAAVLENRYADFMRPLDPIKETLRKHKETLDALTEKTTSEGEKIGALESLLADRLTVLDDFLTATEAQTKTLDILVKRVGNIESNTGITPPEELYTQVEAEEMATEAEAEAARPKTPEEEGYQEIGNGFYVRDVKFKRFGSSAKVTGEIKNLSDSDYQIAIFSLMVYNLDNVLVSDHDFTIKGIKRGGIKKFRETLTGANPGNISKYVVRFKRTTQF
ncbi:MAG: hypothetical protein GY800_09245 [Planctomycetes bacterium]|nr:hypothetical protein [Planctomycetota bacterium]